MVKNLSAIEGDIRDMGMIPGSGRFPGEGHGNLFQNSCLENPNEQRSQASYSPWGQNELHMTKRLQAHTQNDYY